MPGTLCLKVGSFVKLTLPALALLVAMIVAVPLSGTAEAQAPPGDEIVLVNAGREMAEGKEEGRFIATANYILADLMEPQTRVIHTTPPLRPR